jgi:hypothetical protein
MSKSSGSQAAIIPFSFGAGECPTHNLVPMLGSAVLAALLQQRKL